MPKLTLSEKYERSKSLKEQQNGINAVRGRNEILDEGMPNIRFNSEKPYEKPRTSLFDQFNQQKQLAPVIPKTSVLLPTPTSPIPKYNFNREYIHNSPKPDKPILDSIDSNKDEQFSNSNRNLYGSPIKSVRFTPSKLRPTKIYKVFNHQSPKNPLRPNTNGILVSKDSRVHKNVRNNSSKNQLVTSLNPQKKGVFDKLRSFLTSLTKSEDETDFERLSKSAKDFLNIKSDPLPMNSPEKKSVQKKVVFNEDPLETPIKAKPLNISTPLQKESIDQTISDNEPSINSHRRSFEDMNDIDVVDETLRINSELRKRQELNNRIKDLMETIDSEKHKFNIMQRHFEREMVDTKENYESKINQLELKVRALEANLESKNHEIEDEKLEEIKSSFFKEHESFLSKYKKEEMDLLQRQKQLEDQRKDLQDQIKEFEHQKSMEPEPLDNSQEDLDRIQLEQTKLKNKVFSQLEANQFRYDLGYKNLSKEISSLKARIEDHDYDLIKFSETIQLQSQAILDKRSGYSFEEIKFLKDLELLLDSLDQCQRSNEYNYQSHLTQAKLHEYNFFFQEFRHNLKSNTFDLDEVYSLTNLRRIEIVFEKLKNIVDKKIIRKSSKLKNLDNDLKRFKLKWEKGQYSLKGSSLKKSNKFAFKNLLHTFQSRSNTLHELLSVYQLLIDLNELVRELGNIRTILEFDVDIDVLDQYEDYMISI